MTAIDPLAHLRPKSREAQKKARLLELADSILAARNRGVSLTAIATGIAKLQKKPISVSIDYLSEVMAEYHGEAWPKPKPRIRKAKVAAGSIGTDGALKAQAEGAGSTHSTAGAEGREQVSLTGSEPTAAKPANGTASRFHSIRKGE